jgi:hypothetical protein
MDPKTCKWIEAVYLDEEPAVEDAESRLADVKLPSMRQKRRYGLPDWPTSKTVSLPRWPSSNPQNSHKII